MTQTRTVTLYIRDLSTRQGGRPKTNNARTFFYKGKIWRVPNRGSKPGLASWLSDWLTVGNNMIDIHFTLSMEAALYLTTLPNGVITQKTTAWISSPWKSHILCCVSLKHPFPCSWSFHEMSGDLKSVNTLSSSGSQALALPSSCLWNRVKPVTPQYVILNGYFEVTSLNSRAPDTRTVWKIRGLAADWGGDLC